MAKTTRRRINKDTLYTKGGDNIANHTLPTICHATHGVSHHTVAETINLRAGHNRHDYYTQRSNDKLPTDHKDIILACQAIYRKVGVVRNILDIMTDFAAEGLELQHPIKSQQRFYKEWARRVNLDGRAHDFMKLLMRDANVIVRRKMAFISKPVVKEMAKGEVPGLQNVVDPPGEEKSEKISTKKSKVRKREIPWKYTFLSPVVIEKLGGEVGRFFGADTLGMRIPPELCNSINSPRTTAEKDFVAKLPREVVLAAKDGKKLVSLEMDKMYVDYYKKDDWEDWGTPFLYGVLEDVMLKEKMRLADIAALDGVINVIRLWKLGNSDQQILPTSAAVDKLIDILQHNVGGGVMDLVWDDMIDLKVEYPPTDKILGNEKYYSVNADIVRGIGIPDSLIGGSDLSTRNPATAFVQLKTLVERLEYVRGRAIRWMENELRMVADAMGFKKIPSINFGIMSLRDEAAEKQLIIQLLDRGIISAEKATEVFGVNYMIELERMKEEQQVREENPGVLERANPYYRPISTMEKQTELAIELEEAKQGMSVDKGGGDNPSGDQPRDEGDNPSGRPPNTVDTKPRDERTDPTLSVLQVVAQGYLDTIDEIIDTPFLQSKGVKNMRSLTRKQKTELEGIKRGILSVINPGDVVTKELITTRLNAVGQRAHRMEVCFRVLVTDFATSTQREPNFKERRMLTSIAWGTVLPIG